MTGEFIKTYCSKTMRKKTVETEIMETPLKRCLNVLDITFLGIGHMVGAGIYVLTGTVSTEIAGPGVVLSYAIAGFTALLASLCYAELGALLPKAGSAYTYTYVLCGELIAFLVGWNIVLEHFVAAASVARVWSGTINVLSEGKIVNGTIALVGSFEASFVSNYLDFLALGVICVFIIVLCIGVALSVHFNNFLTVINIGIITFIIIVGLTEADGENWNLEGGFLPFGFPGVVTGAATCFFSFIGFEAMATAGEEAKNPGKDIPIATLLAMCVTIVLYMGTSITITLMVPYYDIDIVAPFPMAFEYVGLEWAKYLVAIGTLFGMTGTMFGGLFALPRAVYAISSDGLFFKIFAKVNEKTQVPVIATVVFGLIAGGFALLFEVEVLVELLSIGALFAFVMVAFSIIILRYQNASVCPFKIDLSPLDQQQDDQSETKHILDFQEYELNYGRLKPKFKRVPILRSCNAEKTILYTTWMLLASETALAFLIVNFSNGYKASAFGTVAAVVLASCGVVACCIVLCMHQQIQLITTFKVPFVPILPALSMFLCVFLMMTLSVYTWLRLIGWMLCGLLIYLFYGVSHSEENEQTMLPSDGDFTENTIR